LRLVYRVARKALRGTLARPDAHDVAQEIVMEYLEQIRAGNWQEPKIAFRSAVRARARDRAIDRLREWKQRATREHSYMLAHAANIPGWMHPELALEEKTLMPRFERALGRLSPRCLSALLLVREEGLSYGETALRLGITRAAVNQLIVRAGRQLRKALAAEGFAVEGFGLATAAVRPPSTGARSANAGGEDWAVRTVKGLLWDSAQYFRKEFEKREWEDWL
jgi:RNA polymerase sigma-70 factor (ECF subfamily)